jgi:poly(rC)-binding protein 2/3/4
MSAESGAQIRILAKEEIPSCASDSDELVQVNVFETVCTKLMLSVSFEVANVWWVVYFVKCYLI